MKVIGTHTQGVHSGGRGTEVRALTYSLGTCVHGRADWVSWGLGFFLLLFVWGIAGHFHDCVWEDLGLS